MMLYLQKAVSLAFFQQLLRYDLLLGGTENYKLHFFKIN